MFEALFDYSDLGFLILRLALGAIFIVHAMPKLKSPASMAAGIGWPANAVMIHGVVEVAAALAVIFDAWLPLGALAMVIIMIGAIYYKTQKWHLPFFAPDKTGWEFDLLILVAALLLLTNGGGTIGLGL